MAKIGTLNLNGASGQVYDFNVYEKNTSWADHVACVYYVSKRTEESDGTGDHTAIYVGQTEDMKDRFANHHKQDCFNSHGYNAISVHRENNKSRREDAEQDLIKATNPPCND